jgi:peroxidase
LTYHTYIQLMFQSLFIFIFCHILLLIQAREYRTLNGTGNNIVQPLQGSIQQPALLSLSGNYSLLKNNNNLPGARLISNLLFSRPHRSDTLRQTADLHTQYGLFIMLDICGLEWNAANNSTDTSFDIPVPGDDAYFSFNLRFRRWSSASNQYDSDAAKYLNYNTAYLDLSPVYGYTNDLRTFEAGQLNESVIYNAAYEIPLQGSWYASGDSRTNMLPVITSIVKIWIRYHNSIALKYSIENPWLTEEELFQEARRFCIAVHQKISTREWLAALLGGPLAPYTGYKLAMHAQVSLLFAVSAARFCYSQIHPFVSRRTANNQAFNQDLGTDGASTDTDLPLLQCLYRPIVGSKLDQSQYMDAIITGSIYQVQGMNEARAIDTLRNTPLHGHTLTFAPANDLIALTIQRGRDVGLPKYNQVLKSLSQPYHVDFNTLSSDSNVISILRSLYLHVDDIDLFVGMSIEDRQPNSGVGNLLKRVIRTQLQTLRDGDRFWYENPTYFSQNETSAIYEIKWSLLLKLFTSSVPPSIPDNIFYVPGGGATSTASLVGSPRLSIPLESSSSYIISGQYRPNSNYVLSWIINTATNIITIQVDCLNGGWVGIGWGNQLNTMKGADIALMWFDPVTGIATIQDSFALDVGMPTSDLTLLGGTDDMFDKSGAFDPITFVHTFKFSRLLTTADIYDSTLD